VLNADQKITPNIAGQNIVGLFDSGVGGLTVLNSLLKTHLPVAQYAYFGDTAWMPYGNKSAKVIEERVRKIIHWHVNTNRASALMVACNTSAALLYNQLRDPVFCPVPFIDPISPITAWLGMQQPYKKVGLLATPGTVKSEGFTRALAHWTDQVYIKSVACEGLAAAIEQGTQGQQEVVHLLHVYLAPLLAWGAEAIILGCTHYPLAKKQLALLVPAEIALLDPADWMAEKLACHLGNTHGVSHTAPPDLTCSVSGLPGRFQEVLAQLNLPLCLKSVRVEHALGSSDIRA
jgi:glutamate racemase